MDKDDYIYPGEELMIPQGNIQTYIVENGETLYDVSNKLNTNVDKIIEDNDSIYLLPGQLLIIKK